MPAQVTGPVGMEPWGDVRAPKSRRLPARWLRKEFASDKKVRRATVSYSGLGLSELYLNGEKVGDHVLSPGVTEYPKRVLYVTFDVTDQIKHGENALGVMLGNGRYYATRSKVYAGMPHYGFPSCCFNLRIEYDDGSVEEIVSDESWKLTGRRPDPRQQRIRRRGVRRPQGVRPAGARRASTTRSGKRPSWSTCPKASSPRR